MSRLLPPKTKKGVPGQIQNFPLKSGSSTGGFLFQLLLGAMVTLLYSQQRTAELTTLKPRLIVVPFEKGARNIQNFPVKSGF